MTDKAGANYRGEEGRAVSCMAFSVGGRTCDETRRQSFISQLRDEHCITPMQRGLVLYTSRT